MSKSLIIVALSLAGLCSDVFAQQYPFESAGSIPENVTGAALLAADGNPWALPDPNDYRYNVEPKPPEPRPQRPKYITPEELKQLGRLPPERNYPATGAAPLNQDRQLDGRYRDDRMNTRPGYYGRGYYPSGSYYGSPYGTSPLYDPYGGAYDLPYGGMLPFLY